MRRALVLTCALALAVAAVLAPSASAAIGTTDLNTLTATDLANTLVGSGVSVSNVTYTGANVAAGTFTGGAAPVGFDTGVILSSGNIANVVGPNVSDSITTVNGTPGDSDLTALSGHPTFDAAVLEFDFVPNAGKVFFQYVFASDEYNEYVNSSFNDTFGFFVDGANCATVGDPPLPVAINTINNGNPFGTDPKSHPELYRNNDLTDGGGSIDTEMDGLTTVLTCEASVNPNVTNHMKLAIADASDSNLDSNVFIQAGSLTTVQPATLKVVKHVVNDDGGTASAGDFTLSVTGSSPSPATFPGAESPGTQVALDAGSYSVAETGGPSGYTSSLSADCSGTIAAGETKTCTVTNDDVKQVGTEGCSHGFWKKHLAAWAPTGYSPNQAVSSVFSGAGALGSSTLLKALSFKGGSTLDGAERILLRQAVAALLNAAHPGVSYPKTTAEVISDVNAALASGQRTTILSLASSLDALNNLGCPL
jgi:hypothetical protein